jgi:hypothetical protein
MTISHKLNQIYHSPEHKPTLNEVFLNEITHNEITHNEIILRESGAWPERNSVKTKVMAEVPEELTSWGYGSIPRGLKTQNAHLFCYEKRKKKLAGGLNTASSKHTPHGQPVPAAHANHSSGTSAMLRTPEGGSHRRRFASGSL